MDLKEALKAVGLSEGEIKVYLALLKLGSSQVSKLKEETNLHRTTIYDFIEKLINKGLVGYVIKNNIKFYSATHPSKLLTFLKEKEEGLKEVLPSLIKLSEYKKEEVNVEVLKGIEGFKTLLNNILRAKKEFVAFGIDETRFKEKFPVLMEQYFKKEKKLGIKERMLTSEKNKFLYKYSHMGYRFIPDEFFNPTPTGIYGENIFMIVWEPLTIIHIKNKSLADSYRKHFELLWNIAKGELK